ncbi:endonuclease/exonuclease/phosphatase family protein [Actinomycetospora chiangmaiensis]|uniref:endonuclease/exonuclease/phosphatase family protein n=1 Tax=Actinomycetospora chiangmaiensis TaxID=402650 RepID=UPI000376B893|nr:endonuclease/exonuclease/phosphatase family protein [Actinomycetospora chiangmaiensis]
MTRPAWWEEGPGPDGGRPGPSRPPGGRPPVPDGGSARPAGPRPAPTARYDGPPGWNVPPGPPVPPRGGPAPAPRRRPPSRWRAPGAEAVVAAVVVAGLVGVVLFPEALGLDERSPFVQVVAFRPQLTTIAFVLALLAAFGAWRRAAAGTLVVALAVGLVSGIGAADVVRRTAGSATVAGTSGGLVVLALNTYTGLADADDLAALVQARDPDLISLPEARGDLRRRLESRLDEGQGGSGYRAYSADDADDASGMTVFVRSSLGRPTVVQDREGTYPAIVVDLPRSAPGVAAGLRFVADHPRSPKPGDTNGWVRDVGRLAQWCDAGRPTVIAGDMNATADHAHFRSSTANCTDVAAATGDGVTGTWPSWVPAFLGAQIDHVLVTGGPRPLGFEITPVGGTDHRAVLARIGPG